jgi:hypothetical protein
LAQAGLGADIAEPTAAARTPVPVIVRKLRREGGAAKEGMRISWGVWWCRTSIPDVDQDFMKGSGGEREHWAAPPLTGRPAPSTGSQWKASRRRRT